MTAEKGNKVYTISEAEKDTYQSQGYDIFEDGKVIAYGKGKTVPYEDYMKLQEENERLKEMIASSEEDASSESGEKTTVRKTVKSK